MPFFNERLLPNTHCEYVLWLDIMGTRNKMTESVRTSATFMFKLHVAVLESLVEGITAYPVMDGAYITSSDKKKMETFICKVFSSLGKEFIKTEAVEHQFLIKGSLAYGPIIHGKDLNNGTSRILDKQLTYRNSILIGMPMIQACTFEKFAPPFGVFVHESARAFSPQEETPYTHKWWRWFLTDKRIWKKGDSNSLISKVKDYYEYCYKNCFCLDYPKEKIDKHKDMFNQYFSANI